MKKHRTAKDTDWKARERLVALIEKCFSPDARVQHDVHLPVLGTDRTRQCDAVIRFGEAPCDSLAIVEVQLRKKRPDINTFHGWVHKMREVGAQQLICVSAKGYPSSIVQDVATRLGPTVKLLTLRDLEAGKELSGFVLAPSLITPKFKVKSVFGTIRFDEHLDFPDLQLASDERVFSFGAEAEAISLNDIITQYLVRTKSVHMPPPHEMASWSQSLNILFDKSSQLWFHHNQHMTPVAELPVSLTITCDSSSTPIPVHGFSYRQELLEGVLAWVTTTRLPHQGREVELTIIVKPDKEGLLNSLQTFLTFVDSAKTTPEIPLGA